MSKHDIIAVGQHQPHSSDCVRINNSSLRVKALHGHQ